MWLEIPDKLGITEETCPPLRELKKHIEAHEEFAKFSIGMDVTLTPSGVADYGDLGVGQVLKVNPDDRPDDDTMYRRGVYIQFKGRQLRLYPRELMPVSGAVFSA